MLQLFWEELLQIQPIQLPLGKVWYNPLVSVPCFHVMC